jgi:methionyl-tRNA synthetase
MISILLSPFIPAAAAEMQAQLGVKPGLLKDCKFGVWKGKPKKGRLLFQKV